MSIAYLERAWMNRWEPFSQWEWMESDTDLAALRKHPRYREWRRYRR
ncbi:hypothetical protein [Actinoplanes sp. NPDC023714]